MIRAAASGEEALAVLATSRIDLMITDLVMPGMDGLALVRRLKRIAPATRVIIITAYGSAESMAEAEALGVSCYLAKPFDLSALKSKVNELLGAGAPLALSPDEPDSGCGRGALCFVCSGAGRGLGTIASASRRALEWVKPRNVMAAVGKVTGAISGRSGSGFNRMR